MNGAPSLDEKRIAMLRELAAFVHAVSAALADGTAGEAQIVRAQALLDGMDIPEGRVRIFSRSLLHMLTLILRTRGVQLEDTAYPLSWGGIWQQLRLRLSTESFEMRFAMRLAAVMTVTGAISFAAGHTFLLDSAQCLPAVNPAARTAATA